MAAPTITHLARGRRVPPLRDRDRRAADPADGQGQEGQGRRPVGVPAPRHRDAQLRAAFRAGRLHPSRGRAAQRWSADHRPGPRNSRGDEAQDGGDQDGRPARRDRQHVTRGIAGGVKVRRFPAPLEKRRQGARANGSGALCLFPAPLLHRTAIGGVARFALLFEFGGFAFVAFDDRAALFVERGDFGFDLLDLSLLAFRGVGERLFGGVERVPARARDERLDRFAVALRRAALLARRQRRDLLGGGPAQALYDLSRRGERFLRQRRVGYDLRDAAREQILVAAPSFERRLLARRGDIGIVKADRRAEHLQLGHRSYTSRLCRTAAAMKLANSGCGSNGLLFSSGWNWTPTNQGCSGRSTISGSMPSGDMPLNTNPPFSSASR